MDINILDSLLYNFETLFIGSMGTVKGYAVGLLQILMVIDFVLAILLNLGDDDHIKTYLKKLLKYGIWIYLIQNWGMIVNAILQSFIKVGIAAGGSSIGMDLMKSPSTICTEGLRLVYPLVEYMTQFKGIFAIFENPWIIFLTAISILVILAAFIIISIQIFVTYVEFYITATQLLIFLPFGANKFTSFMAEKAIGGIMAYGVKIMVMTSILAAMGPIVRAWTVTANATPTPAILTGTMAACLLLAYLCWHVPGMAAGIMTGAPSLTAGSVAATGVAAGAAVVGAGMAGSAVFGALGGFSLGGASTVGGGAATGGSALAHAANAMPTSLPGQTPLLLSSGSGASDASTPSMPLLPSGSGGHNENSFAATNNDGIRTADAVSSSSTMQAQTSEQQFSSFSSGSSSTINTGYAGSAQYNSASSTASKDRGTSLKTPETTATNQGHFAGAASSYRPSTGLVVSQAQRAIPPEAQPQGSFQFPLKD